MKDRLIIGLIALAVIASCSVLRTNLRAEPVPTHAGESIISPSRH